MENTLENKAKFVAQYWGQPIYYVNNLDRVVESNIGGWIQQNGLNFCYLELKSLSTITDEDAIDLGKIIGYLNSPFQVRKHLKENYPFGDSLEQPELDYLRSKGYALPYMGLSVKKLIEYKWIKLK